MELVNIDACYEDIANAIIEQAAVDYSRALIKKDALKIDSIERFFKSDRFTMLSRLNGKFIIDRIKKTIV